MNKKIINLALIIACAFAFSGCWSWQKIISFGYLQSEEEKFEEKARQEQEKLIAQCETGQSIACNNLAVNFSRLSNFNDAKIYYEKACNNGLVTACSNLGQIYEQGLVDENIDEKKAMQLYDFACKNNDGVGCYNQALLLHKNNPQDSKKVLELLAKSCKFEYAQACFLLAKLSNNEAKARKLYERACKFGKCEDK
ncbi:tetratricopeptide repeat protein [Campylobacter sp. 7477a]|uniref:tetratricopeptide repeat protein n=1 Tax=Campylobacter sp. 7477a TaxID=2735741 RepID=UPI0030153A0D|nr:sel1 repeat family protein [Campylobacter sp. 7477a]